MLTHGEVGWSLNRSSFVTSLALIESKLKRETQTERRETEKDRKKETRWRKGCWGEDKEEGEEVVASWGRKERESFETLD